MIKHRGNRECSKILALANFVMVIIILLTLLFIPKVENKKLNTEQKKFETRLEEIDCKTETVSVADSTLRFVKRLYRVWFSDDDTDLLESYKIEFQVDTTKVQIDGSGITLYDSIPSVFTFKSGSGEISDGGYMSMSGRSLNCSWSNVTNKIYTCSFEMQLHVDKIPYSYMDSYITSRSFAGSAVEINSNGNDYNRRNTFNPGSSWATYGSRHRASLYSPSFNFYATWTCILWENGGTINDGSSIVDHTLTYDTWLPSDVTKKGHTFKGWYNNSALTGSAIKYIPKTYMGGDYYYAKWEPNKYKIKLHPNGGTIASGANVTGYTYGVGVTLPNASKISKTGHTFKGWYDNSSLSGSAKTKVSTTDIGDKNYYAKWEANKYKVTLYTNGGTIASGANVTGYTYGKGVTLPTAANITKRGHTFKGWYTNSSFTGNPVTRITTTDLGDKKFWAKWVPNVYSVKLHPNGGVIASGANITKYTYGVGATLPTAKQITKSECEFGGWYDNSSCSGNPVKKISTTDLGNKEYWANWITFDVNFDNKLYVYSPKEYTDIYKAEKYGYRINTLSKAKIEVYFTDTQNRFSEAYSTPSETKVNRDVETNLPDRFVRKVVNSRKEDDVYMQIITSSDVHITRQVNLRYCAAFKAH